MLYVTGNEFKFREAKELFEDLERGTVNIKEIQGSPEEVVRDKCLKAFNALNEPVLVDDASLGISDLGGFPGPYVKDFLSIGVESIGEYFCGSKAVAMCLVAYTEDGENVVMGRGEVEGVIVEFTEGKFGFDPIFKPDGCEKTRGEMTPAEKREVSPRFNALKALFERL